MEMEYLTRMNRYWMIS